MKNLTKFTIQFYGRHVKKHKLLLGALTVSLVFATILDMVWPIMVGNFFELLGSDKEKVEIVDELIKILILLGVLEIVQWVFKRSFEYLNALFQVKNMAEIGQTCFNYLNGHSYKFFNNNFTGSLVKKVNRMTRAFEGIADTVYFNFMPMGMKLLVVVGVFFYFNKLVGLVVLLWSLIFIVLNYALSRYKLKFDVERAASNSRLTGVLADAITNNVNIKLFNGEEFEAEYFKKANLDWYKKTKRSWFISIHVDAVQALLMIALEIVILYVAIRLWQNDSIGISVFFVIQAYLFELFHQLWGFGRSIRNFYEHLADAEEMSEILSEKHEIRDKKNATELNIKRGRVEFKNVDFVYEEKGETVIKNLNFTVPAGMKVALIGPSGGGKSTLIRLILRLYDLNKGKILIDGQNIATVTQKSLREQVALVPQDPILFHRNLMENIRYGRKDASDEEVIAAAKMAHCHDFILKFPQKYKTLVGERGVKLSGGQKQRIAIARAILSNAKILLLDEATSSLDSESEHLIQKALENLMKNKTAFIIAHRLSTIMNVDRILVLQEGQVVEQGSHGDLLKNKSSMYKKLWDLQVGGYL